MKALCLAPLLACAASAACAQVTLDQLDSHVSQRDRELAQFADRLNDPDPEKSLAAMRLLISKGDADQRRMAIRFGLYSPELAVRETVLKAILDSRPTLVVDLKPLSEKTGVYFQREIRSLGGSYQPDGTASVTFKVAGYDEEQGCWFRVSGVYKPCLARMSGDTVSLFIGDAWGQYTLDREGVLRGSHTVKGEQVQGSVPLAE